MTRAERPYSLDELVQVVVALDAQVQGLHDQLQGLRRQIQGLQDHLTGHLDRVLRRIGALELLYETQQAELADLRQALAQLLAKGGGG